MEILKRSTTGLLPARLWPCVVAVIAQQCFQFSYVVSLRTSNFSEGFLWLPYLCSKLIEIWQCCQLVHTQAPSWLPISESSTSIASLSARPQLHDWWKNLAGTENRWDIWQHRTQSGCLSKRKASTQLHWELNYMIYAMWTYAQAMMAMSGWSVHLQFSTPYSRIYTNYILYIFYSEWLDHNRKRVLSCQSSTPKPEGKVKDIQHRCSDPSFWLAEKKSQWKRKENHEHLNFWVTFRCHLKQVLGKEYSIPVLIQP